MEREGLKYNTRKKNCKKTEKNETRISSHWSKRKSKFSISRVIEVLTVNRGSGSWRSGADLLAMHLYCKSSAKYRNIPTHVNGPGDNSLCDWTGEQEVKEKRCELKRKVLLN